jgi:hypothetical protein
MYTRLPIKLDSTSNSEFEPVPLYHANQEAKHRAHKNVKKHASCDEVARERANYLERPDPHFWTYGAKTRGEFLNLIARGA